MAQGAEEPGGGLHKGQGADSGHGVPNPGPQLIGSIGGALGGLGGHLQVFLIPEDGELHLLAVQLLEDGLDLLDGVHLFLVDMGDDVPFLKTAGLGRGGQTLVGGDIGQADDQYALGKEFDAHCLAQRDHIACVIVPVYFRGPGPGRQGESGYHGGQQQEKGAKKPRQGGRPMALFGILQEITPVFHKNGFHIARPNGARLVMAVFSRKSPGNDTQSFLGRVCLLFDEWFVIMSHNI